MTAADFAATVGLGPGANPEYVTPVETDFTGQLVLALRGPINVSASGNEATTSDAQMAKTDAVQAERVRRLRDLARRFPTQPAVYANLLRYECYGLRGVYLRTECLLYDTECYDALPETAGSVAAASLFVEDAEKACLLEPSNGYFALMRAVAYFNVRREEKAVAELERASSCVKWDEYSPVAYTAALSHLIWLQRGDAATELVVADGLVVQDSTWIRTFGRSLIVRAMEAETSGHIAEGIRIRRIVRHVGLRLRERSMRLLSADAGFVWVNVANRRPGGQRLTSPKNAHRAGQWAALAARYMRANGYTDDAAEIERETVVNNEAYAKSLDLYKADSDSAFALITAHWPLMTLTAGSIWAFLWWLAATILIHLRRERLSEPLPIPIACGVGIGAVVVATALIAASLAEASTPPLDLAHYWTLCASGLAAGLSFATYLVRRHVTTSEIPDNQDSSEPSDTKQRRKSWVWDLAYVAFGTMAFFFGVYALAAYEYALAFGPNSNYGTWYGWSAQRPTADIQLASLRLGLIGAVPLLIAAVAALAAVVRRRPIAGTVLGWWRNALPWAVCLMVGGYALATVPMREVTATEHRYVVDRIHDEPRTMAARLGAKWPGR
jgi:hypothetical protein